ncbi:nuclear/nucleolar GTPase 2 [Manihot esculenta]|uniref:Nucleolar GTP-binding protein 2 N-terminal domain-containing protein n=1 Tax=Manihot esculenta TaxID=3983 RepID=A0A2C9W820_MANES|nr:nuclear/nucleolar GTPase 2 [Manihot esculenta]OAY54923.1 hypothetical protein MANES_03G112800v8 [Manihot esculenta]
MYFHLLQRKRRPSTFSKLQVQKKMVGRKGRKTNRKHSLSTIRYNKRKNGASKRSASTVRRLKMYNTKPKRNNKGKILKFELQSKELPDTRIRSDPRWFVNSRVVDQKRLQYYREELQRRMENSYNVILNQRKLPVSL